jgi:hypothetical protein
MEALILGVKTWGEKKLIKKLITGDSGNIF